VIRGSGWHAIEFARTSAILELYIWFRFRPHHRSRHIILHQSPKLYRNRTTLGRKKWWISAILDFRGPIMSSLKSPCATFYRSSIDTVVLNCFVVEKIAFFAFWRQTDKLNLKQPNRWTTPMHQAALVVASGGLIKWNHCRTSENVCYTCCLMNLTKGNSRHRLHNTTCGVYAS